MGRRGHEHAPFAASGDGCFIVDTEGRRYLDASGGPAVSCLGHSNRTVAAAVAAQLDAIAFPYSGFFTTEAAEELARRLAAAAPGRLDRVYFVSGGSEAVESAIKAARQYFVERGDPRRRHVIARRQSYHGNTLGALAAGGNVARRAPYHPLLVENSHIAPCYEYRHRCEDETSEAYGRRVADELEAEIVRLGRDTVMAFLVEPVVGATLGAVPAVDGYFRRIREICDRHGILLILDEVMCGMGRTGTLFASEHDGIAPDIVCLAKGLGAGYQPLGAMICTDIIHDTILDGSGFFQHGHTYQGHPMAVAAGLAVLDELTRHDLIERAATMGRVLEDHLRERFGDHPNVGDIRGRGMFWGLEFVADRDTKEPFAPEAQVAARLKDVAQANGLLCYPSAGTADGARGDHVIIAPPYIITESEIELACDLLARSLDETLTANPV
ncbi:MAG: aspartate aminotransferase family protein [Acidimicrobiia bacterium]|nr:aspartate aminotransferase family protein [Acidimicrobiia bacterium]